MKEFAKFAIANLELKKNKEQQFVYPQLSKNQ